jgi:hypothetical protein
LLREPGGQFRFWAGRSGAPFGGSHGRRSLGFGSGFRQREPGLEPSEFACGGDRREPVQRGELFGVLDEVELQVRALLAIEDESADMGRDGEVFGGSDLGL